MPHHCTLCPRTCRTRPFSWGTAQLCRTRHPARGPRRHCTTGRPCLGGDPNTGSRAARCFSAATLKCCYCQNCDQSGRSRQGDFCGAADRDFMNLQNGGAKNINLVTASQYLPWVTAPHMDAARAQGFSLPVVYNTGGYETVDAVRRWPGMWTSGWPGLQVRGRCAGSGAFRRAGLPCRGGRSAAADACRPAQIVRRGQVFLKGVIVRAGPDAAQ